jgi:hypothetical protein
MKTKILLTAALSIAAAILLIGCGGASNTATNTPAKNAAPANTATGAAPVTDAGKTDPAAKADTADPNTGVAECDEYIKKYEACLTKIAKAAPQVEAPMKQNFEGQRNSFKTAAANPQAKATLGAKCKEAMETAKTATKAYACEF